MKGVMHTRSNQFTHQIRQTVQVAFGIAAVTLCNTPAGETAFEKLNQIAPLVVARNGHLAVGISSNGFILLAAQGEPWRRVVAPSAHFHSVCFGGGKFVAVGRAGAIAISTNGTDWTKISPGPRSSLHSIAYGKHKFVAVGDEGAILRSSDGIRWKSADVTELRLRGIAFGNGAFVAVGYEGLVLTSTDGWNWMAQNVHSKDRLQSIAFGNGRFVAVGWNGVIALSGPERWTVSRLRGHPRLLRVFYQADAFHSASEHGIELSSSDGIDWQPLTVTSHGDEPAVALAR